MKRPSLNHVYRLVWNDVLDAFVAVAEGTRGKGKSGGRLLASVVLGSFVASVGAAPNGGVVTSGSASISQSGSVTNIDQSTQKASINWQGFSIGRDETVNFNQPNSSALTLNRVIGNEKSIIEGALNANGRVFLINSNGMLFTKGSSVNTGGFVGSTLNLSDEDFNAGNYVFKSNGSAGTIINLGTITAKEGGYVALLGNNVSNQGVIVATKGTAALSAGDRITLNFNGDSLLSVSIDEGTLNALVENKQAIYADGGTVILTARAADELLGAQVNNSGVIQARTIDDLKGHIELYAHGGTANVDGTLDASARTSGDGGFIETSGDRVKVADNAIVTTLSSHGQSGTWLIDPTDFTIVAGSGLQTTSGIGADTLVNNLALGNVSIETASGGSDPGDLNVNAALNWSSQHSLTLSAHRDLNVNAPITWGAGMLDLNAYRAININAPLTGAYLELGAYNFDANTYGVINVNAVNALNVVNIGGQGLTYAQSFNINQAQTWSAAPNFSTNVSLADGININAPVTWAGTFEIFGPLNINAGGSLNGSVLDSQYGMTLNVNASNALNVGSITGWSIFNINRPQVWTTVPDMSTVNTTGGGFNLNAALNWSGGALKIGVGDININQPQSWGSAPSLQTLNGNINVNAATNWSAGTLTLANGGGAMKSININAPLTGESVSMSSSGMIDVEAPVTTSAGAISLSAADIYINGPVNGDALKLAASGGVTVNGTNALNVATISGVDANSVVKTFTINASLAWANAPTVSLSGDIIVNAPLSWSSGTLALNGGGDVSINTPWLSSLGGLTLQGRTVNFNAELSRSGSTTASATGDININGALSWSAGLLTLNAGKNIHVNAPMAASGSASLVANYGYVLDANGNPTATATTGSNTDGTPFGLAMGTGSDGMFAGKIGFSGSGTVSLNGQTYTVINSVAGLNAVAGRLSGNYVLGSDVTGFSLGALVPFGFAGTNLFSGHFNGFGHTLTSALLPSLTLPSSIGALEWTNLALTSSGNISIASSATLGSGSLTLNAAGINFDATATLKASNLILNAPITWSSNSALTLSADRDLFINGAITGNGDSAALTFNAGRNININNAVTLTGANATLAMTYGGDYNIRTKASYAGALIDPSTGYPVAQVDPHDPARGGDGIYGSITFSNSANANGLTINNNNYTLVHNMDALAAVNGQSNGFFALAQDLNATSWSANHVGTAAVVNVLSGTLAGLGHKVTNLTLNATASLVGLIGKTDGSYPSLIRDIGVVDANITGGAQVGALLGQSWGTTISHAYSTGTVNARQSVGGLIGSAWPSGTAQRWTTIESSFSDAAVTATTGGSAGGLIGFAQTDPITIINSHATGNVKSGNDDSQNEFTASDTGGLMGWASYANVTNSYATGNVSAVGGRRVGGLIGAIYTTSPALASVVNGVTINGVTNSFATGAVVGGAEVGGLVGNVGYLAPYTNAATTTINNAYATGNVTGTYNTRNSIGGNIGGLVGSSNYGTIANSHATGSVNTTATTASPNMGSLVGSANNSKVTGNFATGVVTGNGGTLTGGIVGNGYNTPTGNNSNRDVRVEANATAAAVAQAAAEAAAQAAEAAAQAAEAYQNAGMQVASNEIAQALKPSAPAPEQIQSAAFHPLASSLDQNIVFADARSFSVDIRSIELDGKTFILNEEEDGKGKSPAVPVR